VTPPPINPPAASQLTGSSVLSGGIWNAFTKLLPQLYTVAASLIMARFLSPGDMGRQSFIAFTELSAVMIFSGGLPNALARSIGETLGRDRPGVVRTLVSWAWRITGVAAALGVVTLLLFGIGRGELRPAWFLAGAACGLTILHSVPSSVLYGTQKWRQATIAGTVTSFLALIAVVVALALGAGIVGIFAVEAVASVVNLVWTSTLAARVVRSVSPGATPAPEARRAMSRFAAASSIAVVLNFLVWRRSDFLFLDRYSTDEQIAFYSIGFGAVTALLAAAQAAGHVLAPVVANLMGAEDPGRVSSGFGRALRLLVQGALPLTAAGVALGPAAIIAAYGNEYRPAVPVLVLLLLPLPVNATVLVAAALLEGLGRVALPLVATGIGAVINVSLDVLLVPGHGAVGAAIASGVAQLVAGGLIVVTACRAVAPLRWDAGATGRAALVALLAGLAARAGVMVVGGAPGLLAGAVLGSLAYAAAATLIRPLPTPDVRWLSREVAARLGPRAGATVARWGRSG